SDHVPEHAVTAEQGVAGDQEVSQIGGIVDVALHLIDLVDEPFHFPDGIAHQNGLKIVPIAQPVGDSSGNGINVLEHGGIFGADDVIRYLGADVMVFELIGQ